MKMLPVELRHGGRQNPEATEFGNQTRTDPGDLGAINQERCCNSLEFLLLSKPAAIGDYLDGWRVCWVGGWDEQRVFFPVKVER